MFPTGKSVLLGHGMRVCGPYLHGFWQVGCPWVEVGLEHAIEHAIRAVDLHFILLHTQPIAILLF